MTPILRLVLLPGLAMASGVCGLAYELLYSRLLATHLGDSFHVNAAILSTFLLGVGLGALAAAPWRRWLWAVEALMGVYALLVAWGSWALEQPILAHGLAFTSQSPGRLVLAVLVVAAPAAFLMGFSVPLFARYLAQAGETAGAFSRAYRLYNLGAAACVLGVEFYLVRRVGVRGALSALAAVNLGTAAFLWPLRDLVPPPPPQDGALPDASTLGTLLAVSAASGAYQLLVLKLASHILGPFHENFALVLALALLGISGGAALVERTRAGLDRVLALGGVAVAASLAWVGPGLEGWVRVVEAFSRAPALPMVARLLALAVLFGVPFVVLGATVPAVEREHPGDSRAAAAALCISSLGNWVGYLWTALVLLQVADWQALALGVGGTVVLAGGVLGLARGTRVGVPGVLGLALLGAAAFTWPGYAQDLGFEEFRSAQDLETARKVARVERYRRLDSQLNVLTDEAGNEHFLVNGYRSVLARAGSQVNLHELVFGAVPALYSARRDTALLFGVGTGISAGATATLYGHLTAVEINPAVLEQLPRFTLHNLGLADRPSVDLVLDDGLSLLARSTERYDAIVNTVTSPLYFSSSKLYTREFFKLAREHLAPGGVYALWFDGRVGTEGSRIIFATLKEAFPECHLVVLRESYSQVVCGEGPLRPHPLGAEHWPPALRMLMTNGASDGMDLDAFLDGLILDRHALATADWGPVVNTFDLPALEFAMTANPLRQELPEPPVKMLHADLRRSALANAALDDEGLAQRCLVIMALAGTELAGCGAELKEATGWRPVPYALKALELLENGLRSPHVAAEMVFDLAEQGRADLVIPRLPRLSRALPGAMDTGTLQAWNTLQQHGDVPDRELDVLHTYAPDSARVRRLLVAVSVARGRKADAVDHLDYLARLRPLSRAEQALRQQLAGEAP